MSAPSGDEWGVLEAARRRADALAARDARALTELHHPALTWTAHTGAVLDRDAYVRGNTEGELRWRSQTLVDPAVTVSGDAAVITAVVVDEVEQSGRRVVNRLRLTQVWIRTAGGWVCLAGHAGPRLPDPAA